MNRENIQDEPPCFESVPQRFVEKCKIWTKLAKVKLYLTTTKEKVTDRVIWFVSSEQQLTSSGLETALRSIKLTVPEKSGFFDRVDGLYPQGL